MNLLVSTVCTKSVKRAKDNVTEKEIKGSYEGLSCPDLNKVLAVLGELYEWQGACATHNASAGQLLTVTGAESKMTITCHRLGPSLAKAV